MFNTGVSPRTRRLHDKSSFGFRPNRFRFFSDGKKKKKIVGKKKKMKIILQVRLANEERVHELENKMTLTVDAVKRTVCKLYDLDDSDIAKHWLKYEQKALDTCLFSRFSQCHEGIHLSIERQEPIVLVLECREQDGNRPRVARTNSSLVLRRGKWIRVDSSTGELLSAKLVENRTSAAKNYVIHASSSTDAIVATKKRRARKKEAQDDDGGRDDDAKEEQDNDNVGEGDAQVKASSSSSSSSKSSSKSGRRRRTSSKSSRPGSRSGSSDTLKRRSRRKRPSSLAATAQSSSSSSSSPRRKRSPAAKAALAPTSSSSGGADDAKVDRTRQLIELRFALKQIEALRGGKDNGNDDDDDDDDDDDATPAAPLAADAFKSIYDEALAAIEQVRTLIASNASDDEREALESVRSAGVQLTQSHVACVAASGGDANFARAAADVLDAKVGMLSDAVRAALDVLGRRVAAADDFRPLSDYSLDDVVRFQQLVRRWLKRLTFRRVCEAYASSKESLRLRTRNRVLREIISTEETYVTSLAECLRLFRDPLRDVAKQALPMTADEIEAFKQQQRDKYLQQQAKEKREEEEEEEEEAKKQRAQNGDDEEEDKESVEEVSSSAEGESVDSEKDAVASIRVRCELKPSDITMEELDVIFANLETIYEAHCSFLDELRERIKEWPAKTCFGDIFERIDDTVMLQYLEYMCNYEDAASLLERLTSARPSLGAFLQQCYALDACSQQQLTAYLIMPVQRLMRVKMLLSELLKYTDKDHVDYANIEHSLESIGKTLASINEKKRQHEAMMRSAAQLEPANIDAELALCDAAPLVDGERQLLFDGALWRAYDEASKKRDRVHLFVFSDAIVETAKVSPVKAAAAAAAASSASGATRKGSQPAEVEALASTSASSSPSSPRANATLGVRSTRMRSRSINAGAVAANTSSSSPSSSAAAAAAAAASQDASAVPDGPDDDSVARVHRIDRCVARWTHALVCEPDPSESRDALAVSVVLTAPVSDGSLGGDGSAITVFQLSASDATQKAELLDALRKLAAKQESDAEPVRVSAASSHGTLSNFEPKSLRVHVHSARNVIAADKCGTSDPRCVLSLGAAGAKKKTKVCYKTLNPIWDAWLELPLKLKKKGDSLPDFAWLYVDVFDIDKFGADAIGFVAMPLFLIRTRLLLGASRERHWFALGPHKDAEPSTPRITGHLALQFTL
jgi:RhoGEF domain/C2 domain